MKRLLAIFSSLKLTLVLLVLAMMLVLMGTFAQIDAGIFVIKREYFETFLVYLRLPNTNTRIPVFPGGYTVCSLLILNLLAAQITRYQPWKQRLGLIITHVGLLSLLLGMLANAVVATESMMEISEGATATYSESPRKAELVISRDTDTPGQERLTTVPQSLLNSHREIALPELPFTLHVERYYPNSRLFHKRLVDPSEPAATEAGPGASVVVRSAPVERSDNARNLVTAVVEVRNGGESLGTFLLSTCRVGIDAQTALPLPRQTVTVDGVTYRLEMRQKRYYNDYAIRLNDFAHDRYAGTNIPKNFSSQVTLMDPGAGVEREVLIYMNHPLRYRGKTYYQAAFKDEDTTTILQVVENPSWLMPYIACTVIALGLLWQFGQGLWRFVDRRRQQQRKEEEGGPRLSKAQHWIGLAVVAIFALWVLASFAPPRDTGDFAISQFARLPVLVGGRVKPLDTVARNSLLVIRGKQRVMHEGERIGPDEWLLDVMTRPDLADNYPVFAIDNPDILGLLGLQQGDSRNVHSFKQLEDYLQVIADQSRTAREAKDKGGAFGRDIGNLEERLHLYIQLKNSLQIEGSKDFAAEVRAYETSLPEVLKALKAHERGEDVSGASEALLIGGFTSKRFEFLSQTAYFRNIPPSLPTAPVDDWRDTGKALLEALNGEPIPPTVHHYAALAGAWQRQDAAAFNEAAKTLNEELATRHGSYEEAQFEYLFNRVQPFYKSLLIYVLAFLCGAVAWLAWPKTLNTVAFRLVLLGLVVHTLGLAWRVWIQGYAPVTNLYSSAVFVGWAAILISVFLERAFRNGMGATSAAFVGFCTLIVAHHLARSGDTMEMMRAVLDSNFWLSTHVLTVTVGYSGAFLAGMLGIVFLVRHQILRGRRDEAYRNLLRMIYGVVCFAAFFSFVGTVLGGIWADQSWGRFWGWDPKENGALLIVLWNMLILHARWDKIVTDVGLAALAVFGNVITAFSWFGVNMLGVGLHSYGFMSGGLYWLLLFMCAQLLIIGVGLFPIRETKA